MNSIFYYIFFGFLLIILICFLFYINPLSNKSKTDTSNTNTSKIEHMNDIIPIYHYDSTQNYSLNDDSIHNYYEITNPQNKTSDEVNSFLDEYVQYDRIKHSDINNNYTNSDIDEHRQNVIDFRNKIENSSKGIDPVDRINLIQISNRTNNNQILGVSRIADIYNSLTNSQPS